MRNRTWALLTLLGLVLFGSQYFPISCTDQLRLSTTSSLSGPSALLILLKTTGQLCPKIQVGLFRFYFLKLSSNYQKGFSSLFSNCWTVPTTSNFPSPGTENSYTQIKCLNHKQRSHFPNRHVYPDWGCRDLSLTCTMKVTPPINAKTSQGSRSRNMLFYRGFASKIQKSLCEGYIYGSESMS